jgi:hypothetical protein
LIPTKSAIKPWIAPDQVGDQTLDRSAIESSIDRRPVDHRSGIDTSTTFDQVPTQPRTQSRV